MYTASASSLSRARTLLLACVCLCAPVLALADPVVVTSGSIALYGGKFQDGAMSLQGRDFDVGVVAGWFPGVALSSIAPGETVDLSTTIFPGGWGFARVGSDETLVNFSGELRFTAAPLVFRGSSADSVSLATTFMMTGNLLGYLRDDPTRLAFSVPLVGTGTMGTGPYRRFEDSSGRPYYAPIGDVYRSMGFQQAAPVPEPGTLWLFGSAVPAMLALRRRVRRKVAECLVTPKNLHRTAIGFRTVVALGSLLLVVPSAVADTVAISITGGSAQLERRGFDPYDATFSLTAPGFTIGGSGPGVFVVDGFSEETFSASGSISAHAGGARHGTRAGTFDLFENDGGGGELEIDAEPFRLPLQATAPFVIRTPFRMAASFTFGEPLGESLAGYSFDLSGSGILTANFQPGDVVDELGQEFFLDNASLDFTAAQTPEPCTLLLVGSGVLALVRRSCSRQRVTQPSTQRSPSA